MLTFPVLFDAGIIEKAKKESMTNPSRPQFNDS